VVKCREDTASRSVCCVIATAVNSDGHREVLGPDLVSSEDGASWLGS
jgi:transposase-like protein